jgi:hypothetical protein
VIHFHIIYGDFLVFKPVVVRIYMSKRSKNKGFSCFDCRNAKCYAGSYGSRLDPPEPPTAECLILGSLPQEVQDWRPIRGDEDEMVADICPSYEPLPTGICIECRGTISSPLSLWHIWVGGPGDDLPACCEACRVIGQEKADKEVEELANVSD